MSAKLRQALSEATDSRAAVAAVYAVLKEERPQLSLASLCRRAGIPSKGYLSQVVNGHKLLSRKHVDGMVAALGLAELEARLFRALVARDHGEEEPSSAEVEALRKALRVETQAMVASPARPDAYFAFEVFCALGLFGNRATLGDLVSYFGESREPELAAALKRLRAWELVEEREGRFTPVNDQIIFGASDDGLSHLGFLKSALRDAEQRLARWFKRTDEAYIDAIILSVDRAKYPPLLARLKADMRRYQSELETTDANMLLRFNVQIYPVD